MTLDTPPKFTAGELNVYRNPADVAAVTRVLRATGRRVALVPTMRQRNRELSTHGSAVTADPCFR